MSRWNKNKIANKQCTGNLLGTNHNQQFKTRIQKSERQVNFKYILNFLKENNEKVKNLLDQNLLSALFKPQEIWWWTIIFAKIYRKYNFVQFLYLSSTALFPFEFFLS